MGVKGTADATGNIFVLVLLFPIMIAKLMANKYHKDGFFGMIKATLAVLIAIGTIFVFIEVYKNYEGVRGSQRAYASAKSHKESYTKELEEMIKNNKPRSETDLIADWIITKNKYMIEADGRFKESAIETLMLATIAFIMLYISIKLFLSSSNRSRALAKAEKEIIPNE